MIAETTVQNGPETKAKETGSYSRMSFANSLIQKLVPKDKRFYPLFDAHAQAVNAAANSYFDLLMSKDTMERRRHADNVSAAEVKGDELIHSVISELTATFLTPFDREDIHRLATTLDGILDELNGGARRVILYEVTVIPVQLLDLAADIRACGLAATEAVQMLKSLRHPKQLAAKIKTIQEHKSRAEETFLHGMASLYSGDYEGNSVLKLREIFYATDNAMRYFAELSFALEAILIKTT
jgi:uncharacterized protein Yka (UPF0111/DUF47 family)